MADRYEEMKRFLLFKAAQGGTETAGNLDFLKYDIKSQSLKNQEHWCALLKEDQAFRLDGLQILRQ